MAAMDRLFLEDLVGQQVSSDTSDEDMHASATDDDVDSEEYRVMLRKKPCRPRTGCDINITS